MNPILPGGETMGGNAENLRGWRSNRLRIAAWSVAALLLLLPLIAMQFTDEVNWTVGDFVVAGVLMLSVGVPLELAVRRTGDRAYRAAAGVALVAAFLLVWLNLAVGIIGQDGDPANALYLGVLAVGLVGSFMARFRPRGMARALSATAFAQASVAAIALIARLGYPWSGPLKLTLLNGFFVALFAGSAWLFHRAAQRPSGQDAV